MKFALFLAIASFGYSATKDEPVPMIIYSPGGIISLLVVATGDPAPTYQWYVSGAKIPAPEGNRPTLALKPPYVAGLYKCTVSNPFGTDTTKGVRISTTTAKTADEIQITVKKPEGKTL